MGFCLFSNAAVAARHAQASGLTRVAVVDFDVHHGNGTQDIFYADPSLFYGSSHQFPCYPGTGSEHERGVADNVVNAPLAPGSTGAEFRAAWADKILPALDRFAPELLIVSAGFDAHKADPLAQLRLETADYGWITGKLLELAEKHCRGRLVSVLEGGYDLDALAASAALHVRTLLHA
jgi:acetoin utilization deacetylase AcuC-like enzyme